MYSGRNHWVATFLAWLILTLALVGCNDTPHAVADTARLHGFRRVSQAPLMLRPSPLTGAEIEDAQAAWSYFVQNEHRQAGLMPTTSKFPSMTRRDQGGYLLAVVSAQRLGLVSRHDAVRRIRQVLQTLSRPPLYQDRLPNKAYNIETLVMTDYANRAVPDGIG